MTIEEKIGTIMLLIIDDGTYVKLGREKSPFGGHVYTFNLVKNRGGSLGVVNAQFRATTSELIESSDIRVIADWMKAQLHGERA